MLFAAEAVRVNETLFARMDFLSVRTWLRLPNGL
jgi:hypothetical protein